MHARKESSDTDLCSDDRDATEGVAEAPGVGYGESGPASEARAPSAAAADALHALAFGGLAARPREDPRHQVFRVVLATVPRTGNGWCVFCIMLEEFSFFDHVCVFFSCKNVQVPWPV